MWKKLFFEIFNVYTNNIISVTDAKVLQYTQVKDLERKPNQLIYIYNQPHKLLTIVWVIDYIMLNYIWK
jgi:hypothetical protein